MELYQEHGGLLKRLEVINPQNAISCESFCLKLNHLQRQSQKSC